MITQNLNIPTVNGLSLAARLDLPEGEPTATILFAHCFTCGKDVLIASRVARQLVGQRFAVLRFDFTGLGASDGDFSNTNFSTNTQDIVAVVDWLRANYKAPSLLIGHSLGGTALLAAADLIPEAKAIITIGSPSSPQHIFKLIGEANLRDIETNGQADVLLDGRTFTIKKQFLIDASERKIVDQVSNLNRPLMIMHSPLDEVVGIEHATKLFHAAKHPKSFISLGTANHLVTDKEDANFIANIISIWGSAYL
jgi:putative redox protein